MGNTALNWLKQFGAGLKQWVLKVTSPVTEFVQEYVIGRWQYFYRVRRFALGWAVFVGILVIGGIVQTLMMVDGLEQQYPVPGGRLREGVVGELSNFNPLFAESSANAAAAQLVFSSLLQYSDDGELHSDLAAEWSSNDAADVYSITLRDDAQWHDGEPVTADDVVFTVELMQDPRLGSERLLSTWSDVEVKKTDEYELKFTLPNSLAAFPPLLRFMIVPEHILREVPVQGLRSNGFNQNPVGSGPFKFEEFQSNESQLVLEANQDYYRGAPQLDRYQLQGFGDEAARVKAMDDGQIDFYATDQPVSPDPYDVHTARLSRTRYLFFNVRKDELTEDSKLRQALTRAVDTDEFADAESSTIQGLLLEDQLKLADKYHQLDFSPDKARNQLDKSGWTAKGEGNQIRTNKRGDQLRLRLVYPDRPQEQQQARLIRDQLRSVGVAIDLIGLEQEEFNQTVFIDRGFDLVLASVDSGIDPDVFVYWHTSQSDKGGLNISGIRDGELDRALAAGRTRSSDRLRKAKYQTAAREWRVLAPAVSLSQDSYHVVSRSRVRAYDGELLANTSDRYHDVHQWTAQVVERLPEGN